MSPVAQSDGRAWAVVSLCLGRGGPHDVLLPAFDQADRRRSRSRLTHGRRPKETLLATSRRTFATLCFCAPPFLVLGSTRFISSDAEESDIRAIITRNSGEPVNWSRLE